MFAVYTVLYAIALLFVAPFEYFRRPSGLRGRWLKERLGLCQSRAAGSGTRSRALWLHAVSVGEAAAAVPFVRKFREAYPQTDIVISTVTDTGQKVAAERMGDVARIIYAPFDLPFCVAGTIRHIRPDLFIIMETEIWPNMIRKLDRRGIPVILANGRISEKSFGGYLKIKGFIGAVLGHFTAFCMQEEQYAERVRLLGAPADRVSVTGNFKFDIQPSSAVPEWTKALASPVIIAGSTHDSEEDLVLDAYVALRADIPGLNLILAPRHPARFAEVEELARKRNIRYLKRSEMPGASESLSGIVVILDVIGELASVYGAADIAIMGGSFIRHGGQNPLEPAYWGKAIICGPHMENFPFVDEFYAEGAAIRSDPADLALAVRMLLSDPERVMAMGSKARRLYEKNTGSTVRALNIIANNLGNSGCF